MIWRIHWSLLRGPSTQLRPLHPVNSCSFPSFYQSLVFLSSKPLFILFFKTFIQSLLFRLSVSVSVSVFVSVYMPACLFSCHSEYLSFHFLHRNSSISFSFTPSPFSSTSLIHPSFTLTSISSFIPHFFFSLTPHHLQSVPRCPNGIGFQAHLDLAFSASREQKARDSSYDIPSPRQRLEG